MWSAGVGLRRNRPQAKLSRQTTDAPTTNQNAFSFEHNLHTSATVHRSDYLPHLDGNANYIIIDDVRRLPLRIADIYRKLTTH